MKIERIVSEEMRKSDGRVRIVKDQEKRKSLGTLKKIGARN